MFCTKCGYALPDGAKFCPRCGKAVVMPEAVVKNEPVVEAAPVVEAVETAAVDEIVEPAVVEAVPVVEAIETTEAETTEAATAEIVETAADIVDTAVVETAPAEVTAAPLSVVSEETPAQDDTPIDEFDWNGQTSWDGVETPVTPVRTIEAEVRVDAPAVQETAAETVRQEIPAAAPTPTPSFSEASASGTPSEPSMSLTDRIKSFFTEENIEKFAPFATMVPIGLLLVAVVFGIASFVLGFLPFARTLFRVVRFLIKLVLLLAAIGGMAGMIYVGVTKKDVSKVFTWLAPLGAFLAVLAVIFSLAHLPAGSWICGILAVVLGLELIARVSVLGQSMDSPIDPAGAVKTYATLFKTVREKAAENKQARAEERAKEEASRASAQQAYAMNGAAGAAGMGAAGMNGAYTADASAEVPFILGESRFDGRGVTLWGLTLLTALVSVVTLGIATPWMICKIYRWKIQHTVIDGHRLKFIGNGGSLLGHWLLWELLTIVTFGIYGIFVYVRVRRWELRRTYLDDQPIDLSQNVSYFDGGSWAYFGKSLLAGLLSTITLGIWTPWGIAMIQRWDTRHQVINDHRLVFNGTGGGFFWQFILVAFLSGITFGIYAPWGIVRINRYIVKHTHFAN